MRYYSKCGIPIPASLYQLLESITGSTQTPLLRAKARLAQKPKCKAQARLVDADDLGAKDASPSVARLADADVPLDSFRDDLARKKALRSVMPQPDESEGIIDELLDDDKDDDEDHECHDDMGFVVDCNSPDTVDSQRLSERDPRRPTSSLGMLPQGDQRDEGISKESVNYRYATGDQKCGNCVNFDGVSSCKIPGIGTVRRVDVCDLWSPARKPAKPDFYGRG